jgi:MoaA/NifB/PqqE/SkfB family radical SAM enzyme
MHQEGGMNKKQKIKYVKHVSRAFHMSWVLTNSCNYSCKFCITANKSAGKPLTAEQIAAGAVNLADKINTLNPYKCHTRFLGGEPTMIKNLSQVMISFHETLTAKNISCCLQTNMARSYDYYEDLLTKLYASCKDKKVSYSMQSGVYPEFTKLNEFTGKLKRLHKKFPQLTLSVKFIADETNYDEMNNMFHMFKNQGFNVDFYPNMGNIFDLNQDLSKEDANVLNQSALPVEQLLKFKPTRIWRPSQSLEVKFEDNSIMYFKNYNQLLIYMGLNSLVFDNQYCSAGFNSVRVEPDGSVYRSQAPCIKLTKSRMGSVIDGFEFNDKVLKCNVPIGCNCMNKLYSGSEYPEYMTKDYLSQYRYPDISGMNLFMSRLARIPQKSRRIQQRLKMKFLNNSQSV